MGNEANCKAKFGGRKSRGTALLETAEIIFRSEDEAVRFKLPFTSIRAAIAVNGELRLETTDGPAVLELGANAAKWCDKILHPKTRIEKLGVKSGQSVSLLGEFDKDFLTELAATTKLLKSNNSSAPSDWTFFAANSEKELAHLAKVTKNLKGPAALWIVYPKGQKQITENQVLAAGRNCGLKDVKVVAFSPTHTALKFVIPLDQR
jgi:hypothetical protein